MFARPSVPAVSPRPFLKWAGGKRQLLPHLRRFYPSHIPRYFEPFLGSGAVFFDLWNSGRLEHAEIWLTDLNADLIGCYLQVRNSVEHVIAALRRLEQGHARKGRTHYYEIRDERFNPAREDWQAAGGRALDYTPQLAAMLIYLNRTGYNGLFRQNSRGRVNVPAGEYARPRILNTDLLRAVSAILQAPRVHIEESPFERLDARAERGDFVYFDPPYAPLTTTAQFRSYTARGFDLIDQERLQTLTARLAERGVQVLLSNSVAPSVIALYERAEAVSAGLHLFRLPARRAINSSPHGRGAIEELLVTNLTPTPGA